MPACIASITVHGWRTGHPAISKHVLTSSPLPAAPALRRHLPLPLPLNLPRPGAALVHCRCCPVMRSARVAWEGGMPSTCFSSHEVRCCCCCCCTCTAPVLLAAQGSVVPAAGSCVKPLLHHLRRLAMQPAVSVPAFSLPALPRPASLSIPALPRPAALSQVRSSSCEVARLGMQVDARARCPTQCTPAAANRHARLLFIRIPADHPPPRRRPRPSLQAPRRRRRQAPPLLHLSPWERTSCRCCAASSPT